MPYVKIEQPWAEQDREDTATGNIATVDVKGDAGTISIATSAEPGDTKDSQAPGGLTKVLKGEYQWTPEKAHPLDDAPETNTTIAVSSNWAYKLNVHVDKEDSSATAEANCSVSVYIDGNEVDSTSLFLKKKHVPKPWVDSAEQKGNPNIYRQTFKHNKTLTYEIRVTAHANSSRIESGAAKANANVTIIVTADTK